MPKLTKPKKIVLPVRAISQAGVSFYPQLDIWKLRDPIAVRTFNFSKLSGASVSVVLSLKAVLVWYLENGALSSAAVIFSRFTQFFSEMAKSHNDLTEIQSTHVINYKTHLDSIGRTSHLAHLSAAIRKWHSLGYPGVNVSAVKFLGQIRIKGDEKGAAVLTMDPHRGPFTDLELQSIRAALDKAYASRELPREQYLLAWLFLLLGPRPGQLAALKVCDLQSEGDGRGDCILHIPRMKQREQLARTEFKKRPIRRDIGQLLEQHVQGIRMWADSVGLTADFAPMFPSAQEPKISVPGFEWHSTSAQIGHVLSESLARIAPVSERTGKPIHFTPYRFRYTLGTRAAEEGHGELLIAELLDHSDTQNAGVYVKATPAIIERLDKQLALRMAPLAQAFAGVLVDGAKDSSPNKIIDLRFDQDRPVGGCGTHGFCDFAAPIACYTCLHFHPWLDGPHEFVLDYLVVERDRLMATGDTRIATINDRTILAVAEVVGRCAKIREEG